MAADAAVTREALFQSMCETWQRTEDAIGALGDHFDKPAYDGWSVGDVIRHITAISHDTSAHVRAMLATGEFPADESGNQDGVDKFASLDYKMLRIELNTAHGVIWMYIQRFSDEDLAQEFSLGRQQLLAGDGPEPADAARGSARNRGARGSGSRRLGRRRAGDGAPLGVARSFSQSDRPEAPPGGVSLCLRRTRTLTGIARTWQDAGGPR